MKDVILVCPLNGERMRCETCHTTAPHRREELARRGREQGCDTHKRYLVESTARQGDR
jgi:hypothetical protein